MKRIFAISKPTLPEDGGYEIEPKPPGKEILFNTNLSLESFPPQVSVAKMVGNNFYNDHKLHYIYFKQCE